MGSAVAYELSRRGQSDIHVLDVDLEGELSSTERNAGGVRHLWQHPVNVELARHTIALFKRYKEEVGFREQGYLWLQKKDYAESGNALLERARRNRTEYHRLEVDEIRRRYPFLDKTEDLAFGIFGPRDGLINSNAAKVFFRKEAKAKGVRFHDFKWAQALKIESGRVQVLVESLGDRPTAQQRLKAPQTPGGTAESWISDKVVVALGAWAQQVTPLTELREVLEPVRRQISFFEAENFSFGNFGMVVDSSRVYFHPEGGKLLSGFVIPHEKPGYNFNYDSSFFEDHIWPALYERSTYFERLKQISGWAGMYNYTPDKSGVLGDVPGLPNVFEAHSFTGRGVMQSYGAALALGELILDGGFSTLDASVLHRNRLKAPNNWLVETLHI
ncbi:MAG: FAD-binding oxidoreductase [Bdellovibrionales bacterium]|nr:FAD-binding oxidoreductase [Bdellovibrionales bacterium]